MMILIVASVSCSRRSVEGGGRVEQGYLCLTCRDTRRVSTGIQTTAEFE